MTTFEALEVVVNEALGRNLTKRGYAKVARALMDMPINAVERGRILYLLEYADSDGQPYPWIFQKKAKR